MDLKGRLVSANSRINLVLWLESIRAFQHRTTSLFYLVEMLIAAMLHNRHRNAEKVESLMKLNNIKAKQGWTMPISYSGVVVISDR